MKKLKLSKQQFFQSQYSYYLFIGIILLSNFSCGSFQNIPAIENNSVNIKFIIRNGAGIEHLAFTNSGGFREEDLNSFSEKMEVKLNNPINDFYQLILKKENKIIVKQLWLKGEDITIKGNIENNEVQIDTILNSPFYYYTQEILNKLYSPEFQNMPPEELNKSLLKEVKNNIDSPFSNEIASIFIRKNINQPDNLKMLQLLLTNQKQEIKDHMLSIHDNLDKIIKSNLIKISDFNFNNKNSQQTQISFDKDSIYLIDFWFTACPPCIKDHKTIKEKYGSFKNSPIVLIGISTNYHESAWISYLSKQEYSWENYLEIQENGSTLSNSLGISNFPTYLIVNGKGEILNRNISLEKSINFLKESNLIK